MCRRERLSQIKGAGGADDQHDSQEEPNASRTTLEPQ